MYKYGCCNWYTPCYPWPHGPYMNIFIIVIYLVPNCYIPLGGNRAALNYFCCEGVFKFCKKCGVFGHYTSKISLLT